MKNLPSDFIAINLKTIPVNINTDPMYKSNLVEIIGKTQKYELTIPKVIEHTIAIQIRFKEFLSSSLELVFLTAPAYSEVSLTLTSKSIILQKCTSSTMTI